MSIPKVLILNGGGARGAYQAGMLQAIAETGHKFDHVYGSSAGAINAFFWAINQGKDLPDIWMAFATGITKVWKSDVITSTGGLSIEGIYRQAQPNFWEVLVILFGSREARSKVFFKLGERIVARDGVISFAPMVDYLRAAGKDPLQCRVSICVTGPGQSSKILTFEPGLFTGISGYNEDQFSLPEAVAASAAFPIVVETIYGYNDGGMGDKSVVDFALESYKPEEVLVIDNGDSEISGGTHLKPNLIQTMMETLDYLIDEKEAAWERVPGIRVIKCKRKMLRTDFNPLQIIEIIKEGRKDAQLLNDLEPIA